MLAGHKTVLREIAKDPAAACPLGAPGDRLWIREPWAEDVAGYRYLGTDPSPETVTWLSARSMPREASRLVVEIVEVRREALQDVPDADLEAEGALWREASGDATLDDRLGFARWWDSLHARPGTQWADNPPVWVITFRLPASS
jgi:hypothetical protein